jgi:hypothetical protein
MYLGVTEWSTLQSRRKEFAMPTPRIRRLAYALAVTGVLGLGTTQAFARPAPADSLFCTVEGCETSCQNANYAYGECRRDPYTRQLECVCFPY